MSSDGFFTTDDDPTGLEQDIAHMSSDDFFTTDDDPTSLEQDIAHVSADTGGFFTGGEDPASSTQDSALASEDTGGFFNPGDDSASLEQENTPKTSTKRHPFNEDWVRGAVTSSLIGITVLFSGAALWLAAATSDPQWARIDKLVLFVIAPFHTLMGTAIGYYFASKNRS